MIVLAVGFAFLIAGTSYYVQGLLGRRVTEEFDDALLAKARILTTVTERLKDGRIAFDYEPALMPEFERDEQPNYFEIYLDSGLALRKSTRLGKDAHLPLGSAYSTEPRVADIRLPDGRAGR